MLGRKIDEKKKTRGYYSGKRGAPVSPRSSPSERLVVDYFQKVSGKLGWKVNGTRHLGRSSGKFPRATEHIIIIWKGSPVFFYRFGCPRLPRNKAVSKQNCHKTGPDVSFSGRWDVKKVFEALNFEGRNNTFMTKWKRFGPLADKTDKLYWLCWTSGADSVCICSLRRWNAFNYSFGSLPSKVLLFSWLEIYRWIRVNTTQSAKRALASGRSTWTARFSFSFSFSLFRLFVCLFVLLPFSLPPYYPLPPFDACYAGYPFVSSRTVVQLLAWLACLSKERNKLKWGQDSAARLIFQEQHGHSCRIKRCPLKRKIKIRSIFLRGEKNWNGII